jgi:hypothetical protein
VACIAPVLTVADPAITIGQPARVQYKGTPGATVRIDGYSRANGVQPEMGMMRPPTTVPANGVVDYVFRPETNTRLQAVDDCGASTSVVIRVKLYLSINAIRHGRLDYTFTGRVRPASANHERAITLYYRTSGGTVRRAVVDALYGTWTFRDLYGRGGRIVFFARTGNNVVNDGAVSLDRPTLLY